MDYKGIIFDFDGTLADTLEDLADSMNRVLTSGGYPVHNYETYKLLVGRGLENLVTYALPESSRDKVNISASLAEMKEDYSKNCLNKTKLYEGIPDLLDELTRLKIRLSLFSNKADDIIQRMAEILLSDWKFEMILGSKPDLPKKPDPSGAMLICKRLRIPPDKMIYLGDSGIDMVTARSAGIFPVGVLWGFRSAKELTENGAGKLIGYPTELLNRN